MKLINLSLFLSLLFFFSCSKDDSAEQELILDSDGTAKVVGYLSQDKFCLLYTSPSPRDMRRSRMPSSA